ncbi:MAG: peptide ABC transporter ATP-binding protein, partial [Actinobacteria bacterium]|nr:peptide ABC transporter ATP-binding protein [Actinomycetota bacterium]
QAQILNLLADLQQEYGLSYLFIAHDLEVVRHVSNQVMVMYLGRVAETGSAARVFGSPRHPYTTALLSAAPAADPDAAAARQRIILTGDVPSPLDPPPGCRFHPRCPSAQERCSREVPALEAKPGDAAEDGQPEADTVHLTACHFPVLPGGVPGRAEAREPR